MKEFLIELATSLFSVFTAFVCFFIIISIITLIHKENTRQCIKSGGEIGDSYGLYTTCIHREVEE